MRRKQAWLLILLAFASARAAEDEIALTVYDNDERRQFYGANQYDDVSKRLGEVKVAVLGRGFKGIFPKEEGERYLPKTAEIVTEYKTLRRTNPLDPNDAHDTQMAHLVWAMTGYHETGPKFKLFNANGEDNFVEAVKEAIKWGAHVVLCSLNWETFGNFDGSGFLTQWVQEAVDEGIIWINAAGNYGNLVYNGTVKLNDAGDWLILRDNKYYVRFKNRVDENSVTITLSWNAFHPGVERPGTDKDLDLYLYEEVNPGKEDTDKPIATSQLKQVKGKPSKGDETEHAYERIPSDPAKPVVLRAKKDKYYLIAVAKKGGTFTDKDRIRITVTGNKQAYLDEKGKRHEALVFTDATNDGEIQVLGDGAGITVGNLSRISARGPTRDGRGKPDIQMERENVTFSDAIGYFGTSYSAADLAGLVVLLKAKEPALKQHHLLKFRGPLPKRYWEKQGWDFSKTFRLPTKIWDIVYRVGIEHFAVQDGPDGTMWLGTTKDPSTLAGLSELPKAVRDDFDDYAVYFYEHRRETTRQVREPDRTEYRTVVVRPAELYWEYERGQTYSNGLVNVTVYNPVLRRRPAQTREVPYTVPGGLRTVPGEPVITLKTWYARVSDEKTPWKENGGTPAQYTRVVALRAPSALGKGIVVDGSEKVQRVWKTPTPAELSTVVKAR